MNVSKRTWILFGIALLAIVAAFASLYFEKEEEIKTLESIEPESEKPARMTVKKTKIVDDIKLEPEIPNNNGAGNEENK